MANQTWAAPSAAQAGGRVASDTSRRLGPHATWRDSAFVGVLAQDNLFHALFHAIPSFEHASRLGLPSHTDFFPRYTRFWPVASTLMIEGGRFNWADSYARHPWRELLPFDRWIGWELMMRAMQSGELLVNALQRTRRMLSSEQLGKLHCYSIVHGGHEVFWPSWAAPETIDAMHPRLSAFRRALLSSITADRALAPAGPSPATALRDAGAAHLLFALRRGSSRVIVNEDALVARVAAEPTLSSRVRFLRLEDFSFAAQLAMVSHVIANDA